MISASTSIIALVLAGSPSVDVSTYHRILCMGIGECVAGVNHPARTVPAAEGEACLLPTELPCVLEDQ